MKHCLLHGFPGFLFTFATPCAQTGADGFRPLFNGKDLMGYIMSGGKQPGAPKKK